MEIEHLIRCAPRAVRLEFILVCASCRQAKALGHPGRSLPPRASACRRGALLRLSEAKLACADYSGI